MWNLAGTFHLLYAIKKPTLMSGLPLNSFALNEGYCCLVIIKQQAKYR